MASSTLAIPASYHKSTLPIQKPKLESKKVRSEDELLKFFLHGSYDVQRGNIHTSSIEENNNKIICSQDEPTSIPNLNSDEQKNKSRCMFEETYMINISVKQPDTKPSSKQIDVRIEKALSDTQTSNNKKVDDDDDDDEISSIFDEEEEEEDEVDSVIFNEIDSSSQIPTTKLTLADMINKTLTTIPALSLDNLNKINNNWYVEQKNERKTCKTSEEKVEKVIKTPPPPVQQATLTTNMSEDEKLFKYLDYLETKEESNQQPIKSSTTTKTPKSTPSSASKIPSKLSQQESIPILDLEQLCRSLTVQDLKDELIRKKIYELKILIDHRHKKMKSQIPLVKLRKDNLPVLIAMPPVAQRRRTTIIQPSTLLQSKSDHLQGPYSYQDMIYPKQSPPQPYPPQRQNPPTNSNRKYHYT